MDDDGIEIIRRDREKRCAPGTHSDVPIIEGSQTTGLVCTICGRAVRENMEYSSLVATEKGLVDMRPPEGPVRTAQPGGRGRAGQRPPSRKDPRF